MVSFLVMATQILQYWGTFYLSEVGKANFMSWRCSWRHIVTRDLILVTNFGPMCCAEKAAVFPRMDKRQARDCSKESRHIWISKMHATCHERLRFLHCPCFPILTGLSKGSAICCFHSFPSSLLPPDKIARGVKPVLKTVALHVTDEASACSEPHEKWLIMIKTSSMHGLEDRKCIEILEISAALDPYFVVGINVTYSRHS